MADELDWSSDDDAAAAESVSDSNAVDFSHPQTPGPDEAGPSRPSLIPHFVDMGFPEMLVVRAVKDNEDGNPNAILQTLLNYGDSERGNSECEASATPVCSLVWTSSEEDDFSDIQGHGEPQWVEDSIDSSTENLPSPSKKRALPSFKRRDVSPLKLAEIKKLNIQRKKKKWSLLEEATLRKAVEKYGVGNWKYILSSYNEIFENRMPGDLKDKWRNMTKN